MQQGHACNSSRRTHIMVLPPLNCPSEDGTLYFLQLLQVALSVKMLLAKYMAKATQGRVFRLTVGGCGPSWRRLMFHSIRNRGEMIGAVLPFLLSGSVRDSTFWNVSPAFRARIPSAKPLWKYHRHARKNDSQVFLNSVKLIVMINNYDG